VCAIYVRICELVRIAEAEIDVGLSGEVEDGVNLVLAQHTLYVRGRCNVPMLKGKVLAVVEDASVIQGRAIVELVEGYDIVAVGVRESKVSDEPACTEDALASIMVW
jgi:hypothetical protein